MRCCVKCLLSFPLFYLIIFLVLFPLLISISMFLLTNEQTQNISIPLSTEIHHVQDVEICIKCFNIFSIKRPSKRYNSQTFLVSTKEEKSMPGFSLSDTMFCILLSKLSIKVYLAWRINVKCIQLLTLWQSTSILSSFIESLAYSPCLFSADACTTRLLEVVLIY